MSKPTVKRSDIELQEDYDTVYDLTITSIPQVVWVAELRGRLSTGPCVQLSRQADHAGEALLRLEEAIEAQGWRLVA